MKLFGWEIKNLESPIEGRRGWRAERFGVTMCANTKGELESMIRQRVRDDEKRRKDLGQY